MRYLNLKTNNNGYSIQGDAKKPKKQRKLAILGTFFVVLLMLGAFFGSKAKAIFDPISVVANISGVDLKETDGRTNVLLLGSDRRELGVENGVRTDTILVASIGKLDNNMVLISLPRDLWVASSQGYQDKINAVYLYEGAEGIKEVVEGVLGIPIHYHAVIDFRLFEDVVDILGGIEVDVENAFEDSYFPIEGKENAPLDERYETIRFEAGVQVMNGETALKYARSRKGTNGEGTDFARSKRQQKVISAIKRKALSLETLVNPMKLKELYETYSGRVDTDVDFFTVQQFYLLSQKINFEDVKMIVLDDRSAANEGGLLYAPVDTTLYGDAYVLIPRAGDYSQIHAYVQKYLFSQ